MDFYTGYPNFVLARKLIEKYENYPILSWKNLFKQISNYLNEYDEEGTGEINKIIEKNQSLNVKNTVKEKILKSAKISNDELIIESLNLDSLEISFYLVDIGKIF